MARTARAGSRLAGRYLLEGAARDSTGAARDSTGAARESTGATGSTALLDGAAARSRPTERTPQPPPTRAPEPATGLPGAAAPAAPHPAAGRDPAPAARPGGSQAPVTWRGHDDLLDRTVSLRVLPAGSELVARVLSAASRASSVEDPRFLAVLDAAETEGLVYVVSEWVEGRTLTELLLEGPLSTVEAARIAGEVARGLSVAHAAGLAHRALTPDAVVLTDGGRVKIVGLAIDAAVHGTDPTLDDAGRAEDLVAAGALLYAGLTRRWPQHPGVPACEALPPAPMTDELPCAPRQVRAAVPSYLDDVACRALGLPHRGGGTPVTSTHELADALLGPANSLEVTGPQRAVEGEDEGVRLLAAPAGRGRLGLVAGAVAAGVLVLGLALLCWQLLVADDDERPNTPTAQAVTPSAPGASAGTVAPSPAAHADLAVVAARAFDPEGNGEENDDRVKRAWDDDVSTSWPTKEYYNAPFGRAKSGVGLIVDLGRSQEFASVSLTLPKAGSSVQIRTTTTAGARPPSGLSAWSVVAQATDVGTVRTVRLSRPATSRYVLVWLTALPSSGEKKWQGGISDVRVRS